MECPHGNTLRRKCAVCSAADADAENARLRRERDAARIRHAPNDLAPLLADELVAAERERDAARAEAREHVREIERLDRRGGEITCERNAAERERDALAARVSALEGALREIRDEPEDTYPTFKAWGDFMQAVADGALKSARAALSPAPAEPEGGDS